VHRNRAVLKPGRSITLRSLFFHIHRIAWKVNSQKSVFGMLHSIILGNRHTAGQNVVGREN
jgi:hypothetical protein